MERKGFQRRGNFDRGPKEMHPAKCTDCGETTEVPFVPDKERPVYCRDCFQNHRPAKRF
ncbi:CxxC-x17-CxxC domain-containing protein [Methanosalsum natronophilum]|uniref:CxxC-x17-CxxC domain-containing protein n=1 Tax=Methanosalsum natronophilum TaxID=768733 RepID=A0A424YVQ5_9EURY|nr:CxxC-x17-CxxC domain-containing protein [Methanosalsum natronophilum]MCS3924690.1 CxxC-x17-CxxC domain-containing protein [Methanosalsum natronophilum]RQD83395.1 MAG: hypothetical protein D5R95_06320 [Methanosalsum natronophilum]